MTGSRRDARRFYARHGVTGFVVDDEQAMARAFERLDEIDPAACCERRFGVAAVARAYEGVYRTAASCNAASIG